MPPTNLETVDLALLALALVVVFNGLRRGLVREGLTLLGLVAAFVAAFSSYRPLAASLAEVSGPHALAEPLAFGLVVLAVLAAVNVVTRVVVAIASLPVLNLVDRLGGAALGAVEAAVLVEIVVVLTALLGPPGLRALVDSSQVARVALAPLELVVPWLPPEYAVLRQVLL